MQTEVAWYLERKQRLLGIRYANRGYFVLGTQTQRESISDRIQMQIYTMYNYLILNIILLIIQNTS